MDNWKQMLTTYWDEKLRRYSEQQVSGLPIDDESKTILREVGLPEFAIQYVIAFEPAQSLEQITFRDQTYTRLGSNLKDGAALGVVVGLKEHTSEIFQLLTKYNEAVIFMNSNLKSLLLFLKIFSDFILSGQDLTEDEFIENQDMVRNLRAEFLSVDPKALSVNNYWSLTLIEFEVYLE